jgi:hypothetical protein
LARRACAFGFIGAFGLVKFGGVRFGQPALSVCPTFGVASRGFWVCWRRLNVFFCAVILGELGAFASFFIVGVWYMAGLLWLYPNPSIKRDALKRAPYVKRWATQNQGNEK